MNADERFDRELRSALAWHADERTRGGPSLDESVRSVAERLGPQRDGLAVVTHRIGTGRSVHLLFVALLLLVILGIAAAIGSRLLPRPDVKPPPFGFAGACISPLEDDFVYSVASFAEAPVVLLADGRLVTVLNDPGETRADFFRGMGGRERRLTDRGIQLLLERASETMPDSGCRRLRSREATGEITVRTPSGTLELAWHPTNPGRRLTDEEEAAAESLEAALAAPETWLPADAWADPVERIVTPDEWLVIVELTPSGHAPGDRVTLSTGVVLEGSDPRYARVVLPDGQELASFGSPIAMAGTTGRCGVLDTAAARRLSESLDALPLAQHDEEELFTTDLTTRVFAYVATGYPLAADCERLQAGGLGGDPLATPAGSPGSEDELASVDPCTLVPPAVDDILGGSLVRRPVPAYVPFGTPYPGRACQLLTHEGMGGEVRLILTLYPRRVDAPAARTLAEAVIGGGVVEDSSGDHPIWLNDCLVADLDCAGVVAGHAGSSFVVITLPTDLTGARPRVGVAAARVATEAILGQLAR